MNSKLFEKWFKEQENVTHVSSFSEVMKRVNRSMHGDNQDYYKVPAEKNEAAQYLLLYEMSLPYGLDLNNQIKVQKFFSEQKPDYVIILAPLYADIIMKKNQEYLEQGGVFIKIWPEFEVIHA